MFDDMTSHWLVSSLCCQIVPTLSPKRNNTMYRWKEAESKKIPFLVDDLLLLLPELLLLLTVEEDIICDNLGSSFRYTLKAFACVLTDSMYPRESSKSRPVFMMRGLLVGSGGRKKKKSTM